MEPPQSPTPSDLLTESDDADKVSLASPSSYSGISHIHLGAITHLVILIIGTAIFGYGWYYLTSSQRPAVQWLLYVFYAFTMIRGVLQFVQNRRMWDFRMRRRREEGDGEMELEMGLVEDEGRWFEDGDGDGDQDGGWGRERDGDGVV